ncbi:MAG: hypothetical protein M1134_05860 [Actinobacteria bacterium]|nr:hypothetical protein [Actinomycetota bacterium]MCL5445502.1 hypothetical protein [Actinomycetota bacterium]
MVPDQYHNFFVACAGVAGTLIGLLFVAVSINPRWEDDDPDRKIEFAIRAGVALVVLVNALVVALFALIPAIHLAVAAISVSLVGLSSCVALGYMSARTESATGRVWRVAVIVARAVVFLLQLYVAIDLSAHPHSASDLRYLAIISLVFFIIGIHRGMAADRGHRDEPLSHPLCGDQRTCDSAFFGG